MGKTFDKFFGPGMPTVEDSDEFLTDQGNEYTADDWDLEDVTSRPDFVPFWRTTAVTTVPKGTKLKVVMPQGETDLFPVALLTQDLIDGTYPAKTRVIMGFPDSFGALITLDMVPHTLEGSSPTVNPA